MGKSIVIAEAFKAGFFILIAFVFNTLFGLNGLAWSQAAADILYCFEIALRYTLFILKNSAMKNELIITNEEIQKT
jgi:hypothetical protein